MPEPAPERARLLSVRDLGVAFSSGDGWTPVTTGISFDLGPGETLALVGESGSGKSVTAMALVDLLPANARRTGQVLFEGEDLVQASRDRLRRVRGSEIAVVFQEPMTALNPLHRIGDLLEEAISSHHRMAAAARRARALELLRLVGLPEPERRLRQYPHQLSGGQRQRAMIAMALAGEPRLLIADEPTTALDVTAQAEILDLIIDLQARLGMAVIMITHDLGVVADLADRVVVMQSGRTVEEAPCAELFAPPQQEYTKTLLASVPHLGREGVDAAGATVPADPGPEGPALTLDVDHLVVEYPARFGQPVFRAVDEVSLQVHDGEVVGLVGESGSGKSTIGRAVLGLVPVAGGHVEASGVRVAGARRAELRRVRREVSIVFQDPASSLDPRASIGDSIVAPLRWNRLERSPAKLRARAAELLDLVRLPPAWADRYPHELSGGQRQRIGIARALAVRPRLLVADEPTSALDVSVQASVLALLADLQRDLGFSCLFISHDLSVVERLCSRVVVLNRGQVEEQGVTAQVLHRPSAAYTRRLIAAVPVPDPVEQRARREARRALLPA